MLGEFRVKLIRVGRGSPVRDEELFSTFAHGAIVDRFFLFKLIQGILAQHGLILHGIRPTRFFFSFQFLAQHVYICPTRFFSDFVFQNRVK